MKQKIINIVCLSFLIGVLVVTFLGGRNPFSSSTAFAVGDLVVNWGVPEGSPIFVLNNVLPGQEESRVVQVTNGAATARNVSIRGIEASDSGNLSDVMQIIINNGTSDIYGPKTLTQFFSESAGINGVPLSTFSPGQNINYEVKVKFLETAGNEYQNSVIVFDLKLGIVVGDDIPQTDECTNIAGITPIFGTAGNDNLRGTSKKDVIIGLEGNDTITGLSGDDCLIGGEGNDTLRGELGNDQMFGGEGNDNLIGAGGNDKIFGVEGNDTIRGENGEDELDGGEGENFIFGGNSNDKIKSGDGVDLISGENGNDQVKSGGGNDNILGGNGNDNLDGEGGVDSVNGQNGLDTCLGENLISCP